MDIWHYWLGRSDSQIRRLKVIMELMPDDYRGKPLNSRQGQPFKPWDRRGYTVIEVLPMLRDKPWDEVALAYVHSHTLRMV